MRRRTPGVLGTDELISKRLSRLESLDPARVVRVLEPFVGEERRARLRAVIAQRLASVSVIFEAPHDPHNGAAVVRSCEAFGVQTLHVVETKERFLTAASVARGAQKWIDVVTHVSPRGALDAAQKAGLELVAAHPQGELLPADLREISRLALVLGNERDGISAALQDACERSVRVPMRGFVESLNVSVTAAILLSAATTGRTGDLGAHARERLYARGLYLSRDRADELLEERLGEELEANHEKKL